jgi:cobalamin biosynthesis protein CbiG
MKLTEKQALALYNLFKTANYNNSYILSLVAMDEDTEAECLIRAIDKILQIAKIKPKRYT